MEELVAIARIAKPRGLRGEVLADVLTDFPERFEALERVTAVLADGTRREMKLEGHWFQKGRVVLKFAGVNSPEEAESVRDADICVPESEAAELEEDQFFDWQLEGCDVQTIDGARVGVVTGVMRTGGTELLVVRSDDHEYLIPFANAICTEVDVENKRIRIDPPEGLLSF